MAGDRNDTKSRKRKREKPARKGGSFSPFRELRNSFFTGLIVVTPVTVTAWLVYTFVTFVDSQVKPLIPRAYNPETYLPFAIPGLGLVFAIIFITMLGALAANILGRSLLSIGERIVDRVPLVRNIYSALKQIVETVARQSQQSFKHVALVEYPRPGLYALAFLTADSQGELRHKIGADWVALFVPTTPNPTSGFLLYAKRSEIKILEMTVEEGAKLIISAGLVAPEYVGGPVTVSGPEALESVDPDIVEAPASAHATAGQLREPGADEDPGGKPD